MSVGISYSSTFADNDPLLSTISIAGATVLSVTGVGSSTRTLSESLVAQTCELYTKYEYYNANTGGTSTTSKTISKSLVTENGTYSLSVTNTKENELPNKQFNYTLSVNGTFAAYYPLSVSISSNSPVNINSLSTSTVNVSNGAGGYSTTWSGIVSKTGGISVNIGTTFSQTGGNSGTETVTVKDVNSTTRSASATITVKKLVATVSPIGTTNVKADSVNLASWIISTQNDNATSYTYEVNYSDVGSTNLINTASLSGATFSLSPTSLPADSALGLVHMDFRVTQGTNIATTAIVAFDVVDSFTANIAIDGVGIALPTLSNVYYASLSQNPQFIAYATFSSTATTAVNFNATWQSTTGTTNFSGANSLSGYPLTYGIYGFNNVNNLNKITYIRAIINNVQPSGTVSTTSSARGLAWSDPVAVNIYPQIVNLTVNTASTTKLKVTATGGSFNGGGSAYNYKWYVNDVINANSSSIFGFGVYSTSQVLSIFCQVQSQNTLEIAETPEVNVYINGSVKANILNSTIYGMIGDAYQITGSANGGSPPYSYAWTIGTKSTTTISPTFSYSTSIATATTLQFTATDTQGASASSTVFVSIYAYANPQLNFVTNYKDLIKVNATTEVQVSVSGNATYSYNFILNGTSVKSGASSTYTFSTTTAGSYSVYAIVTNTDTSNIMNTNIVTIEVYKEVGVQITKQYSTTVVGNGINFFGQAVGGSPPYTYEWYVNTSQSTTGASTTGNSQSITLIEKTANTYYVYLHASDSAGNSINSGFSTTYFVAKPSVTISGSTDLKVGQKGNWSADIVGGSGVYDYTWYVDGVTNTSNGNFSSAAFSSSFSASGLYNIQLSVYDVNYRYQLQLSNSFNVAVGSTNVILSDVLTPLSLISETTSTTGSSPPPTSNYKFTVLVGGKNVYATNIASTTSLDLAGQLAFSVLKKYMYSTTNGTSIFMQVGSPVQFYVNGTEVFTGVVETIQMQSNMLYNVVAYDALYYLASIRAQTSIGSITNGVDFGKMLGKLVEYGTVNYNITNTGFGGFSANIQSVQPFYYQLMQLATILGYAVYVDNSNTLHLVPYLGTTPLTITQNDRNYFSTTSNDTNYFYNSVSLIANNSDTLSTTIVSTTISGATNASKRLDLSWLTLNGATWSNGKTSDTESLAEMALGMFPNGYREVDIWYSLNNANATTFLNLGNNFNITLDFADGRVWTDMFIETVSIDSTGLTLKCVNFPKDIWSQIQTVTGNAQ